MKCPADGSINKGVQGNNKAKLDSPIKVCPVQFSAVPIGIIMLLHMQTLGFKILSQDKSEPAQVGNNINIIDFFMSISFCRSEQSMEYRLCRPPFGRHVASLRPVNLGARTPEDCASISAISRDSKEPVRCEGSGTKLALLRVSVLKAPSWVFLFSDGART